MKKNYTFSLDPVLLEDLKKLAAADNRNASNMLEELIKKEEAKKKENKYENNKT